MAPADSRSPFRSLAAVRREPYRVFFPLALVVGWAGTLPWFLFGRGYVRTWPGFPHALTMTQGFLLALVVGFLGTMIPRRSGAPPLSTGSLATLGIAIVAVPLAAFVGRIVVAEVAAAAVLAILGGFAIRAFAGRTERRPPPPSFVLVPLGLLFGFAGACLVAGSVLGALDPWALSLGRQLAQQGLMLALVLAVVPVIGPILMEGRLPTDPPPHEIRARRAPYLAAGILLAASFLLEEWVSARSGLLVRGAVVTVALASSRSLFARPVPGLHRRLFRIAPWLVAVGLLAAGGAPGLRVPALHLAFIGGFSLLALAVSVHVTLTHGGREGEARGRQLPVLLAASLTIAAAAVRYLAERIPSRFFEALTLASGLWLAAAVVWGLYLAFRLSRQDLR